MLTCREVTERVTDYLERDLSWRQRLQFRLHLLMCGVCRRYVAQMQLTTDLIRRLRDEPVPAPPLDPALREAFRSDRGSRPPSA